MATNSPQSVHALVRLLKSSTDPPSTTGPSKIELACLAWSDPSFRAANKGEIIGEWILTLLGQAKKTRREKDVNPIFGPIADSRYWSLLCAVLTTPPPPAARPLKAWLLPLLNRFQADTIVIDLLALRSPQVLAPAQVALSTLWPLVEKRIGVDALAECLGAVFNACAQWDRVDDNLRWICSAIVGAYRNALANAGNKKKLYSTFLNTYIPSWLLVIRPSPSLVSSSSTKELQDSLYAAGTDTLFSLEALKQPLDTLFDALSPSISSHRTCLPNLCVSFLSAVHRHRSALFVSAMSTVGGKEEVRTRGMEFVGRCWVLLRTFANVQDDLELEKWKSIIGLSKVVEKERLFVPRSVRGTHTDTSEYGGGRTLSGMRDEAIQVLQTIHASSNGQAALSIQLLGSLIQIEYDIVGSVLERVLSTLIDIPQPFETTAMSDFLTRVLEYHIKTRTVHTYVLTLLDAVISSSASPSNCTHRFLPSTFHLAYHLPTLAHAIRTSLTPTQTAPLATAVLQAFDNAWTRFKDAGGEGHAKKCKVTEDADKIACEEGSLLVRARVFCSISRVAGTVLSNLPAHAYAQNEEYSLENLWADVGKLGWIVIWDCLKKKIGKEHVTTKVRDGRKRKHAVEAPPIYPHIVASAVLRFLYDVRARVSFLLGGWDQLAEVDVERLLDVARDGASDPELVLETIRTLLWHVWYTHNCEPQKQMEAQPILDIALDILTACPWSKSSWSGVSADLTRDNLGLAVLYVLMERWLDALDALASKESLERLILILLEVSPDLSDEDTGNPQRHHVAITLRDVVLNLLQNAQLYELHNIRAVFLSCMLSLTAPLSPSSTIARARAELTPICNVYCLLHYVPPEYFTRHVRTELVERAMAGDVQLCILLRGMEERRSRAEQMNRDKCDIRKQGELDDGVPTGEIKEWSCRLTYIRVFLQRMGRSLGNPSHFTSSAFVNHLLSPPSCIYFPTEALTRVTLDLIESYILNLLRSQELAAEASISSVISTFISARPFSQPNSEGTWTQHVVQSSILKLIERTTSDFDPTGLHAHVKHALKTLLEALESMLSPHAKRLVGNDIMEPSQFFLSEQIEAWTRMLSLRRWLGMSPQVTAVPLGLKLATLSICNKDSTWLDSTICSSILGLLFEEFWCMPGIAHRIHLDIVVGFYAVNGSDIEPIMDAHVAQASKRMTVEDFTHLLGVLEEGIGGSEPRVGHLGRFIHLSQLMLHDAPQGTLKVIQHFATRCFNLFVDQEEIFGGSLHLKSQLLEFIARYCSDRPAAVRSVDLGSIWTLLHKTLSGSSEHAATTVSPIFHHIVSIIGALVRLRRDLVVHTLPHLGLVLRQLIMLTRAVQPQLGAKQNKMVTDTFPSWLSAFQPLSTDEARALARLLTSLTTKTVPRTRAFASNESQKAESLAKPFAKHASYVLTAYVDAFNDPLCIINAEVRRNLEPGLFALCEMVGEHSRDALMVSTLDAGGKTIMKSLWKEYEKQRYVGKG